MKLSINSSTSAFKFPKSTRITASLLFNNEITEVISLGSHALADSFLEEKDLSISEPIFPLNVMLDCDTGLLQNEYLVEASIRYNWVNYSYTSSNSKASKRHFKNLAQSLSQYIKKGTRVLEIGANDGYLLEELSKFGANVFAIDASESMVIHLKEKGIKAEIGVFSEDVDYSENFLDSSFDLIIANNVLNHSLNPVRFFTDAKAALSDSGLISIEVPYWLRQVEQYRFDMIYHEHTSYFSAKAIKKLADFSGLVVQKISEIETHGGSLRIELSKRGTEDINLVGMIEKEEKAGIFTTGFYETWQLNIQKKRNVFMSQYYKLLEKSGSHKKMFGIGAAAKANTFLTYYGLNKTNMNAITDTSPLKIGKFTPLTRLPIKNDQILKNINEPVVILLAWNLSNDLKSKISQINRNVIFFPHE